MKSSRRRFLQSVAAVPVLGAALTTLSQQESHAGAIPKDMIRFQLGVASYSLREFDRAKAIAMTKRAGLKYICFKDMHLKMNSTDEECKAAAEECQKAGVTLYGCGVVYMNKAEEVENAFRYAKAAGMQTLVGVPKPDLLPLVDEKVKETEICVAVHNHGPGDKVYGTPEIAMDHIGKFDKRIGLCIDVGHTARIGGDVVKSIRDFKDRIYDVHFKDSTEASPKGGPCICGRGVLDLPSYLAAFIEIGYDRIVSFEYETDGKDPLPGLMESVGYVRGVLRMMDGPIRTTTVTGDPNYFEKTLREWYSQMFEDISEEEREGMSPETGVFMGVLWVKKEAPELLAASPELIELFNKKTYDAASTKAAIREYVKIFEDFEVTLPQISLYCLKRFDKNDMTDVELELARRVLEKSIDQLKTELK